MIIIIIKIIIIIITIIISVPSLLKENWTYAPLPSPGCSVVY